MSIYTQYKVTLFFHCRLPERAFTLYALDANNAVDIAKYDAQALGYKIAMLAGHTVEVL